MMPPEQNNNRTVKFPDSWKNSESLGYGTYPGPYNYKGIERYQEAVMTALRHGYRHIDTAQAYNNELYVGRAILDSEVPRNEIFLTSKLNPAKNSYQGALMGIKRSRAALKTDIDLFLIHYPGMGKAIEAWKGLVEAKAEGHCKHVGVSNFEIRHFEKLLLSTDECPEVNQIEFHPLIYSKDLMDLVKYCKGKNIQVEGYCPLAWGDKRLLESDAVTSIADNLGRSPTQVIIKWCMQHGVRPIAGSLNPDHILENAGPYDFLLSEEEMEKINVLGKSNLRVSLRWNWDPQNAEIL